MAYNITFLRNLERLKEMEKVVDAVRADITTVKYDRSLIKGRIEEYDLVKREKLLIEEHTKCHLATIYSLITTQKKEGYKPPKEKEEARQSPHRSKYVFSSVLFDRHKIDLRLLDSVELEKRYGLINFEIKMYEEIIRIVQEHKLVVEKHLADLANQSKSSSRYFEAYTREIENIESTLSNKERQLVQLRILSREKPDHVSAQLSKEWDYPLIRELVERIEIGDMEYITDTLCGRSRENLSPSLEDYVVFYFSASNRAKHMFRDFLIGMPNIQLLIIEENIKFIEFLHDPSTSVKKPRGIFNFFKRLWS